MASTIAGAPRGAFAPLPAPEPLNRRDWVPMTSLVAVAVGFPLLLSAAAGMVGLPGNDDWVYMRAANSFYETGAVGMVGHTAAFIGQLLLVQPLLWLSGGNPWAFTAFGLLMAAVGVAATYLLARRFVGTSQAAFVALLVILFPGVARMSASFMTDVPAYALTVVSLLLGTRWLQGAGGRLTLVGSVAVGLIAVSIREFALAAPLAVLACAWERSRSEDRLLLGSLSLGLGAGLVGVMALAASVLGPGGAAPLDVERILQLGPAFTTLSAGVLPVAVLVIGRRFASLSAREVLLAATITTLALVHPDGPLLGNLWTSNGVAGNYILTGTRAPVIGAFPWSVSQQFALLAGILVATVVAGWSRRNAPSSYSAAAVVGALRRVARRPEGVLVVFAVAYVTELAAYAPLGNLFDRYLYPLLPVAAILLVRRASPLGVTRSHATAHAAVAWLAVSGFLIAANSFAYDAARDRDGKVAQALGYPADRIDAGYEWVGTHATKPAVPRAVRHGWMPYDEFLASAQHCVVLSNSRLTDDAMRLIRKNPDGYRLYLLFGPPQPLYLYAVDAHGCPPLPAHPLAG